MVGESALSGLIVREWQHSMCWHDVASGERAIHATPCASGTSPVKAGTLSPDSILMRASERRERLPVPASD